MKQMVQMLRNNPSQLQMIKHQFADQPHIVQVRGVGQRRFSPNSVFSR